MLQVWDPEALADTSSASLHHRHKSTPYQDMKLLGRVKATFVQGHLVFTEAEGPTSSACGSVLLKSQDKLPNKRLDAAELWQG